MILIQKAQSNTVCLTLKEKTTIAEPVYVFKFVNDLTGEIKVFTAADESIYPNRYNQFTIIENAAEDVENGVISLSDTGKYSYTVYEQAVLDLSAEGNVVETGKVDVKGTSDSIVAITDTTYTVDENGNVIES